MIKAICKNEIKVNINADIMSYLPNPNYLYATRSYLLTTVGRLYNYDINQLNYDEEIPATLDNLYATEVATNVKHFDEYNNYYYCDKEQSDNLSGYDFYLIKTENDWKYGRLIQNEEPSI